MSGINSQIANFEHHVLHAPGQRLPIARAQLVNFTTSSTPCKASNVSPGKAKEAAPPPPAFKGMARRQHVRGTHLSRPAPHESRAANSHPRRHRGAPISKSPRFGKGGMQFRSAGGLCDRNARERGPRGRTSRGEVREDVDKTIECGRKSPLNALDVPGEKPPRHGSDHPETRGRPSPHHRAIPGKLLNRQPSKLPGIHYSTQALAPHHQEAGTLNDTTSRG